MLYRQNYYSTVFDGTGTPYCIGTVVLQYGQRISKKIVYSRPTTYGSKNCCVDLSGPSLGLTDYSIAPPTMRCATWKMDQGTIPILLWLWAMLVLCYAMLCCALLCCAMLRLYWFWMAGTSTGTVLCFAVLCVCCGCAVLCPAVLCLCCALCPVLCCTCACVLCCGCGCALLSLWLCCAVLWLWGSCCAVVLWLCCGCGCSHRKVEQTTYTSFENTALSFRLKRG
jgi:hypothetical protein